jgi:hypothetical protein
MERKESLWRKLTIQVEPDKQSQKYTKISSRQTTPPQTLLLESNDHKEDPLNSPSFRKSRTNKPEALEENYSFCGQMLEEIGNLLLEGNEADENK